MKRIAQLYDDISAEVIKSSAEWESYLRFASGIYKYKFDNAMLIYAQRPNATMVADQNTWENRVRRMLNDDAESIAVFDVLSPKPVFRYLYDVADTHGDERTYPRLWRLNDENANLLLEKLKENHHPEATAIEEYISLEVMRRTEEIRPGFYEGIKRNLESSPLTELDSDENLKTKVNVMIWQSSIYMMYCRCGFDTSSLEGSFEEITQYNNKNLLYRMGNCATIIAQDFLSECAGILNKIAREQQEKQIKLKNAVTETPPPPVNIKREIKENITKQARRGKIESSAQLSLFPDEPQENDLAEEVITHIILRGSLTVGGKERIYNFFKENQNNKERADFLKNEYGICGGSLDITHGLWGTDSKGMEISIGNIDDAIKKTLSWSDIAKRIQSEIDEDKYYIPETPIEPMVQTEPETQQNPAKFQYGDYISYKGNIYEVLDEVGYEDKVHIGNISFNVSPHTYIMVESATKEELETAELTEPPENVLPKLATNAEVELENRKYRITRIDEEQVHLLDITYENNIHPQLFTSKSDFITSPIDTVKLALQHTPKDRLYGKDDFFNAEVEFLSKEYDGRTFYFPYAKINADRYLMNFAPHEQWTDEMLNEGRKTAYRDYLMDYLGNSHKDALVQAEIISENDYDSYFSDEFKVNINDEFSYGDRTYAVLNFDEYKKEVLLRDITNDSEENLPLYEMRDIPFVYRRTQAVKDLRDVELNDFLNSPVEFLDVKFGSDNETSTYTYGYLNIKNAVMYMNYTVDKDWTEKDIEFGKRRAYSNYLSDVMGYSDKEAATMSGLVTDSEYDEMTSKFIPASSIPNADEVINAPAEEIEHFDEPSELVYTEPKLMEIRPDIPLIDYIYSSDDEIGVGGPKAKFTANIEAIRILKTIEEENRMATADEQKILCRYVGWGGLADAFNSQNTSWNDEYETLKGLLSDEEYESARASTLCAHYTPPEVIKEMYAAIENFGFTGGNILDPAMGTGLFFSAMPENLRENSRLYGYELDNVSGRIAMQLNQNADIRIQGFENTDAPDNFFDIAVGNVPFGDYRLHDPKYNKYKFYIHDYFVTKALDKVRPGGIVAFITSKGTLDKENPDFRKHIGSKAELIGAVRLPNNTFRQMANTSVTTDILFLQKRERIVSEVPYWVELGSDYQGIPVNAYYEQNPFMMLGKMEYGSRFGENTTTDLVAPADFDLQSDMREALSTLETVIPAFDKTDINDGTETIPADPSVRNFNFTFLDDTLYYRENSIMRRMDYTGKALERIKALCEMRDTTRDLIDAQSEDMPDLYINELQEKLNSQYDVFIRKNGNISDSANERVFRDDSDYPLLCSLEVFDDETKTYYKADMFSKRTIRPNKPITFADNAVDALRVSLCEKGCVDFDFMSKIYRNTNYSDMYRELSGLVYINPEKLPFNMIANISLEDYFDEYGSYDSIETADEYLSGNVRHKLSAAEVYAENNPGIFTDNVTKLTDVQPPLLTAAEIDASIGVTWIDCNDYAQFMYDVFDTPYWGQSGRWGIDVEYNQFTNVYSVRNKSQDSHSVAVTETFGTSRKTAYEIFEDSLNLRSATVYDPYEEDGKTKYKVNNTETMLAREKQGLIKEQFRSWIFEQPERRKKYVDYYNVYFNNIRLRKYDGSFLTFQGMTQDLELRPHQRNAVARALFSNTSELLDHKVGAGKSFVMVASCMEMKRLGLAQKSIFVVPNHLTGQMGSEFLRLYPSAKILVTTKRDFEKQNRLKFVSKIATGDWDAVIIGHSQFEKIAMSKERQIMTLQQQVSEIIGAVAVMREENGESFTIKQMEKMKENLSTQIKELQDDTTKDDLITFESLGIDYMYVDEAHYFKNCAVFSKMRNVAGISQTKAKKSTDMLMKCRYMNEINNGRGIVFATGTPISNSMTEMFVMQRYLDPKELENRNMQHFDAWAAQFGEVVTALELAPEGTGYRYRTRFAKFKNMPELLSMYHNFADVVTDEDLKLPIPKIKGRKPTIVTCMPSDFVILEMMDYVDRADKIHQGIVKSWEDNMLKVTNEARLLATDPRLIDPSQENTPESKVSKCADNVFADYQDSDNIKGTQIVFCDIGTPTSSGKFNVYDALKEELITRGIPENDICFIHDAKTDSQREELFAQMRSGEKRIIIGSTSKLGVGTNIQNRLVSLHHLDCPWRPADIEQRDGRGLRQGNMNDEVAVYRYVTQNTFDSYMWQLVENKQRFISQIKSGKLIERTCEDIDETVLSYAEVKAIATGDERIKEKMDLDLEISRLQMLKANYDNQRYSLQDQFTYKFPTAIKAGEKRLDGLIKDNELYNANKSEDFVMTVSGKTFTEREEAGKRIMLLAKSMPMSDNPTDVGDYCGFKLQLKKYTHFSTTSCDMILCGSLDHTSELSTSPVGNTVKLDNVLKSLEEKISDTEQKLEDDRRNMELAKSEYEKPFTHTDDLAQKIKRQAELNEELDLNKNDDVVTEDVEEGNKMQSEEKSNDAEETVKSALLDMPYSRLEKQNYTFLKAMFPDVINGQKNYMKWKCEGFDDMYVEKIGDSTYAVCLFYVQNGDLMYDPEYTFRLDNENKAARVLTWEMSALGMYHEVYDRDNPNMYKPEMKKDLDKAFNQTLRDIENINYEVCVEETDEDEIEV